MTSAPKMRLVGAGGQYAGGRGQGLVIFASVVLAVVSFAYGGRENLAA